MKDTASKLFKVSFLSAIIFFLFNLSAFSYSGVIKIGALAGEQSAEFVEALIKKAELEGTYASEARESFNNALELLSSEKRGLKKVQVNQSIRKLRGSNDPDDIEVVRILDENMVKNETNKKIGDLTPQEAKQIISSLAYLANATKNKKGFLMACSACSDGSKGIQFILRKLKNHPLKNFMFQSSNSLDGARNSIQRIMENHGIVGFNEMTGGYLPRGEYKRFEEFMNMVTAVKGKNSDDLTKRTNYEGVPDHMVNLIESLLKVNEFPEGAVSFGKNANRNKFWKIVFEEDIVNNPNNANDWAKFFNDLAKQTEEMKDQADFKVKDAFEALLVKRSMDRTSIEDLRAKNCFW